MAGMRRSGSCKHRDSALSHVRSSPRYRAIVFSASITSRCSEPFHHRGQTALRSVNMKNHFVATHCEFIFDKHTHFPLLLSNEDQGQSKNG
jgi:hypothetical protein